MYIRSRKNDKVYSYQQIDPLKSLDKFQEEIDSLCVSTKGLRFSKSSRICRNIVIHKAAILANKWDIVGPLWGLMAARPVYYFYPFKTMLTAFINCDNCSLENFSFLKNQLKILQKENKEIPMTALNGDIYELLKNSDHWVKPAILELDGMKTLVKEAPKILDIIENGISNKKTLLILTTSVGRSCTQEDYLITRQTFLEEAAKIRPILEVESIEYAEPRHENGAHYPMRVDMIVFDKAA